MIFKILCVTFLGSKNIHISFLSKGSMVYVRCVKDVFVFAEINFFPVNNLVCFTLNNLKSHQKKLSPDIQNDSFTFLNRMCANEHYQPDVASCFNLLLQTDTRVDKNCTAKKNRDITTSFAISRRNAAR